MSETPKRYDPSTLRSIYDANGGDSLLADCHREADEAVFFCSENALHPGTTKQQKVKYSKSGFKMVEFIYDHADGTQVRSIKFFCFNGVEYRAENSPQLIASQQILTNREK